VHKLIKITLAAALPVVWAAGCSDFLKGGELTNNPNNATQGTASDNQLFIPIQVNQEAQQSSEVSWSIAQWMQSLYGANRQQVGVYNYANSSIGNTAFDGDFNTVYTGGGLIDIRQLQGQTQAQADSEYTGIALVMEGWMMGNASDWWGDLPYSQAVNYFVYPTPVLDAQQLVYDTVIAKLDRANAILTQGGVGPAGSDLVYGGDTAKWGKLAHTLKARYLLHEVLAGGATYAQVLAEANQGISASSGDYLAYYAAGIQLSSNNYWQFMSVDGGTGRAGDMISADTTKIVKLMKAAVDPRMKFYFDSTNSSSGFMNATFPSTTTARLTSGYRQPLVTANENLLIIAEAKLHTGDAAGALIALNAEQAMWGVANAWHPAIAGVPLASVANDSTIGTEIYIALFQNVEVWSAWKRLCFPKLLPVQDNPTFGHTIPSRLLYGITEQQTNPNIPAVGTSPNGAFNWNDTRHGCTLP
jgi:hypothetical protein